MGPTGQGMRLARTGRAFVAVTSLVTAAACGGDPPIGPDALRPETFELVGVRSSPLPVLAYTYPLGGSVWLRSAELKSVEPARSIDPRIFEDRSGVGGSGGGSRDSTTASARMADVRVFEEHSGNALSSPVTGTRRDSSAVLVERRGDLLLIQRLHPDPRRTRVDTARFDAGYLVVQIREWENFGFENANALFTYQVRQ